jgi:predicted permease
VTPIAAFAIGVFGWRVPSLKKRTWLNIGLQLIIKLFVVPLLVMPFLLAFSIVGIPRRMAVVMSALPVALSCYVLSLKYEFRTEESALMVIISTILMPPTQLMWLGITTSMGW